VQLVGFHKSKFSPKSFIFQWIRLRPQLPHSRMKNLKTSLKPFHSRDHGTAAGFNPRAISSRTRVTSLTNEWCSFFNRNSRVPSYIHVTRPAPPAIGTLTSGSNSSASSQVPASLTGRTTTALSSTPTYGSWGQPKRIWTGPGSTCVNKTVRVDRVWNTAASTAAVLQEVERAPHSTSSASKAALAKLRRSHSTLTRRVTFQESLPRTEPDRFQYLTKMTSFCVPGNSFSLMPLPPGQHQAIERSTGCATSKETEVSQLWLDFGDDPQATDTCVCPQEQVMSITQLPTSPS